jgi:hypothetical protein
VVAVGLSAGAVARIRFAVSALWEVAASLRVLRRPDLHAVHLPWVDAVRPALVSAGLVDSGDSLLWQLIPSEPGYLPDFLTPAPSGLSADLDTELATLRETPATVIRTQLALQGGQPAGVVRDFTADPASGMRRLTGEISAYWRIALATDWPRIRRLLDVEMSGRARELAEHGAADLLNGLHERVNWADGMLSVAQRYCDATDVADGHGLILVPSVFVWPTVLTIADVDWPQLAYPARGVATLWERAPRPSDALIGVLGRTRAALLVEMRVPASTSELARRTGITAGGASQHLVALRAAGLVSTRREGRSVMNVRTKVADALLAASA